MKYISEISIFTILICALLTVQSSPLSVRSTSSFSHTREKRWWFDKTTTETTTETPVVLPNDLVIGVCTDKEDEKVNKCITTS